MERRARPRRCANASMKDNAARRQWQGNQARKAGARVYVEVAEKRFKGVKQCC